MRALRRTHTSSSSWIHLRSVLYVVVSSSSSSSSPISDRNNFKSPWSRKRRKHPLSPEQWKSLFSQDGKLRDGGVKVLKKVRSGGVDPRIRAEVWPFLLGVKEYESLRRQCRQLVKRSNYSCKKLNEVGDISFEERYSFNLDVDSPSSEDVVSARESLSTEGDSPDDDDTHRLVNEEEASPSKSCIEDDEEIEDRSIVTHRRALGADTESSDSESSVEASGSMQMCPVFNVTKESHRELAKIESLEEKSSSRAQAAEDFATWQRIIRLDAVRASSEWVVYSPAQAAVSEARAWRAAEAVRLKDYDHLEPSGIFHAARLVAVLEAYALYDPEIGYCQGMSDLLSPIIAVIEEDHEAFWCFVGFMRKARHNFRLDEMGIRRQLNVVSKIIKSKDSHLYKHLEKLKAEDCFFVYRMVVVLFRRELSFEQTVCLWEVMWADQAAIRAGIGKSAWGRIRQRAPPTDDLLLYAIAACVLQRKKLIIEKYSSMDEIIRECNNMAGQLDVWKLLDDAHDLVVTLHDKIR
ncbi:rab GTPase-activating protein 22-like isoform X2 [Magnolia sinica]|uniref:rab GTPase-activating protein 22-like isoform X2 n=1 Tax=Magnolia sinica TaxID=86752 RepID=UPI00265988AF|nr:rab GTPase-activating protein 22-like isoform X2 [Magnolia sinica]